MTTHDQIHQAFQRIIAEATPTTPSGSHKIFVVGQLVVNVQSEEGPMRLGGIAGGPCCGKCHK